MEEICIIYLSGASRFPIIAQNRGTSQHGGLTERTEKRLLRRKWLSASHAFGMRPLRFVVSPFSFTAT
ncbi:hypothetical protein A8L48_13340 [Rhizobium rhizogenes]|nr:hypothetical protein B0909_00120 [Rhizobium rhizogenes]OAM64128.1 hypothetical protein A8L48_13340 [Rhizobium rhizogenes]